jgi:hypothetical protein
MLKDKIEKKFKKFFKVKNITIKKIKIKFVREKKKLKEDEK